MADERNILCLPENKNSYGYTYPLEWVPVESGLFAHIGSQLQGLVLDVFAYVSFIKWHVEWCLIGDSCSQYDQIPQGVEKKGLIVFLHALDHPVGMWKEYIDQLTAYREYDVWAPRIKDYGNTGLESALSELIRPLENYLTKWPERPVVLIGSSNGARLGLALEIRMRKYPNRILLIAISGVFNGTNRLWIRWLFTNSNLYQEYKLSSRHSLLLLDKARRPVSKAGFREYIFYGAGKDIAISPINSSFPLLGKREKVFFVPEEGHVSIVNTLKFVILGQAMRWLNNIPDFD
ncbi:MAG: alpha/beta fold hydrolase [Endozoicomonas sp.]